MRPHHLSPTRAIVFCPAAGLACLAALAAAILLVGLPASGATKTWIGGSGQWDVSGNWSPSGQPQAGNDVNLTQSDATSRTVTYYNTTNPTAVLNSLKIDATGAGTMTLDMPNDHALSVTKEYVGYSGEGTLTQSAGTNNAATLYLGYNAAGDGTYTLTGGTLSSSTQLVGYSGKGALGIQNGGQVTNVTGYLGYNGGSSGTATVTGAGSKWTNSGSLDVGNYGSGTLNIEAGGQVSNTSGYVGDWSGSTGTATVTGADSKWINSSDLYVGYTGSGTLNIEAGGQVSSKWGYLGNNSSATGTATVTGPGSTWTNSDSLFVGQRGSGTLSIEAGGQVSSKFGCLGLSSGSTGTATVTGAGSKWTTSTGLDIGGLGSGTLNIGAGGQVSSNNGTLAASPGSSGTLTVTGAGSKWSISSNLSVGRSGSGTLNIEAGGDVSNTKGYLGYSSGATGTATVTGTGSMWTNSADVYLGFFGSGTLSIQAGGQVINDYAYLGYYSGSTGTATVSGAGSTWTNSGMLYVGLDGNGTLRVADGGLVTATVLLASLSDLSGDGTITVTSAVLDADLVFDSAHGMAQTIPFGTDGKLNLTLASTSILGAGYRATGTLRIADAVTATCMSAYLGYLSGCTGSATVSGTGSKWATFNLYIGNSGSGTLNIEGGGQVTGVSGYLGYNSGSTGTATVSGAGSKLTITGGSLYVGNSGSGTLNIELGGLVKNGSGVLGYNAGSTGKATVTGTGSAWNSTGTLYVGYSGSGTLTVADGGKVTAKNMSVNSKSAVRLHVSGSGMLVLGDTAIAGSVANSGAISFYAGPFLPAGTYTPISEYAGRAMTWSGTGSYNAYGGTWDNAAKTFAVAAATALMAGATETVSTGERLLYTDPGSGQRVGTSFGSITGDPTFSASPMSQDDLAALALMPGFEGLVLSAWDFDTTLTGGDAVLLSFDIGLGAQDPGVWHYKNGVWGQYAADLLTYDCNGILSFTVTDFSGYAVTAVPEPATFALLAAGAAGALLHRRRRR